MIFLKLKYLLLIIVLITTSIVRSQSNTVLVDFGNEDSLSPEPWNNLTNSFNGEIANLKNVTGAETGIKIRVDDPFSNVNTNGSNSPDSSLGFPASATVDSFFGNALEFGGKIEEEGAVTLSNLDVSREYTISLFGSRMGVSDNREAAYVLEGIENKALYLDASLNTTNSVVASVKPNVDGTIIIRVSAGPNNNNSKGFFYLGALKLNYSSTNGGSNTGSSLWSLEDSDIYYNTGNVGIGTTSPSEKLEVNGNIKSKGNVEFTDKLILNDSRINRLAPIEMVALENIYTVKIDQFRTDGEQRDGVKMLSVQFEGDSEAITGLQVNSTNNAVVIGSYIGYERNKGYGLINRHKTKLEDDLFVTNGRIAIGTLEEDEGYSLTVKGKMHAQELKIDLDGAVAPDYVFYQDYNLKPLEEVQDYIKKEGHLPNIPSAAEMGQNGIMIKEMNLKLLEKIEELTLYTIAQEKQLETQQKVLENQDQANKDLENRLSALEALLKKSK